MPKVSLATLKNWFKTGLKPTQTQFWDTWDSFWHKDDLIPQTNIDGLTTALSGLPTEEQLDMIDDLVTAVSVSGSGTLTVAAGKLLWKIVLLPTADGTAKAGLSAGASDFFERGVTNGVPRIFGVDHYFQSSGTIHFTGNFNAKVYLI